MNYRTKYLRKVLGCFGTSGASLWASLTFAFSSLVWTSAVTTMVALTTMTNAPTTVEAKDVYHIGAVLSGVDNTIHFTQAIEDISSEANILPPNVAFYAITVRMSGNPIKTAQSVCETLIKHQVYAVIISHPSNGELSPASVSYTCGFYNIPVIGISSRDSSLSDKNLHASFLRTVPPYSHQADVWIEMLKFLEYKCVVFIHSSDNDGRSTLGRFQNLADNNNIKVEPIIEYEPGITDITSDLKKANESHCRVFILYANTEDAEGIFREVEEMNMADPGYVWIASEQCLNAVNRPDERFLIVKMSLSLLPECLVSLSQPTLRELVLMKVGICLWSHESNASRGHDNIEKLSLPFRVKRQLQSSVPKIYYHIDKELGKENNAFEKLWRSNLELVNWSPIRDVSQKLLLPIIMKNDDLNIKLRFQMTCRYCLEDEIKILREKLRYKISNSVEPLVKLWYFKDNVEELFKMGKKPQENFYQFGFQVALKRDNLKGILGLVLINASDERAHIQDSVRVVGLAFQQLFIRENITAAPTDCTNTGRAWDTGLKFVNYMKKQTLLYGKTGHVAFDDKGDRLDSDYDVVNIVLGQPVTVGHYTFSKLSMKLELSLNVKDIIWPGNVTAAKPTGHIIPKHLRVVTIAEKPFVWIRPVNDELECLEDEIYCPKTNTSDGGSYSYCCRGYCMDLLRALSYELNFTYTLYQVEDGQYGSHEFVNGSKEKIWTGMVGELVNKRADMIVAPLTINPERSTAIEFSKPFKYQGITILEKTQPRHSTLASFLQPFHKTLWILVMVSVHVVALALYLLDRFSPFGRYKLPNSDATEEDALNLSSAIWFAWGVLLNSGIGEGTPRSFSARVLGMVWAGFAMIVVASYTANLAAFLVLDRPEMSLTGINDARLRNPMENFTYATVKGSAVDMYFRRQVELSNMYRTMEGKNYENTEEAIEAVKEDRLNAFIWDSSRLEYEAAQDCDLKTAGEPFGRSGYGIGLQRNSFWADDVTLALLKMHEKGDMEDLDNKWILQGGNKCNSKHEKFPATLGLKNMAGVFILVGAGIVGGVGLIIIEIIYKKHQTRKQRRLELARHAADKWRGAVEPDNEPNNDPLHTPSPCYTGFAASLPLYLSAYPDLDINNEPPVETVMPNKSYYEMKKDDNEGSKIKNNKKASSTKPPPYVDVELWLRQSQLDDDETQPKDAGPDLKKT